MHIAPATTQALNESDVPPVGADVAETPSPRSVDQYHVGTLTYNRRGLFNVFLWMLWGDLCLNIMESIIPRLVPLQIQRLGGSNALIGVLTVTIFSAMNWVINPIISTWSDRCRTPLGRRVPFMLFASPFLALFLILVGCSGDVARLLDGHFPRIAAGIGWASGSLLPGVGSLSHSAKVTLAMLATALVLYKFFDLFPQTVYYYLFVDVIPQPVMGRFVCYFRVVAVGGAVLFNVLLLGYADTHPRTLYTGCALLYLFAFAFIILFVKEGKYPPPPVRASPARVAVIVEWVKETYSNTFYWKVFTVGAIFRWITVPFNTFLIIYAEKTLGLPTAKFGHLVGLMMLLQLPVFLFLGPVLDRFHPTRVAMISYTIIAVAGLGGFLLVHNSLSFTAVTCVIFIAFAVVQGMGSTLVLRLLPQTRYGQFAAGNAIVGETGMIVLAWLCGRMLDVFGERYLYLWVSVLGCLGVVASWFLFRAWLKLGGDKSFSPPIVGRDHLVA